MLKLPKSFTETASETASETVKANLDMSEEVAGSGKCPNCKSAMETTIIASLNTWVCAQCRITLPKADA